MIVRNNNGLKIIRTPDVGVRVGMEEATDTWRSWTEIPDTKVVILVPFPDARMFDRYDAEKFAEESASLTFDVDGATEALA